jgi:hypothetical protein
MTDIPNPTPESVAIWLKNGLDREILHNQGWQDANQRFHGITRAARPFILKHFKTPEEQAAAFDGLALALMTIGHFEEIEKLSQTLLTGESTKTIRSPR